MSEGETPDSLGETPTEAAQAPTRSIRIAYALLLTGFFGAHRFYVGKWLSALVYPFLTIAIVSVLPDFTLAKYLLWFLVTLLVLDGCFIPRWVAQRNLKFAEDFKKHPERFLIADTDDIAPWSRGRPKKSPSGRFANGLRVYFFYFVIPALTGAAAAELHSLELLIIPIVILVAVGLIGSLDRTLRHYPTILEIPGVGPAVERVADMRNHFWNHEPKIRSAVWGLFRHWKDYKPYWTLAGIVAATVVIEGVISYEDNVAFIGWAYGAWIVGVVAVLAALAVLANLVPITALSFQYSLSGKRTRLRFMTIFALLATIGGYSGNMFQEAHEDGATSARTEPSFLSSWRLEKRMENPKFRRELKSKMDVFLWYYLRPELGKESKPECRSLICDGGYCPAPAANT